MPDSAYSYREDADVPDFPDDKPVVIFDGMCVLCSGGARWLKQLDRRARYRLMAAQSETGAALFRHFGLVSDDYETMILLEDGRLWQKSDAWLRICNGLGLPLSMLSILRWVPRRIRDGFYEWVARNRFRWFGRRESCYLPSPEERTRYID